MTGLAGMYGIALNHASVVSQHSAGSLRVSRRGYCRMPGENRMHPDFRTEIMQARTAGAHRRADEARQAQAFKEAGPELRRDDTHRLLPRLRLRPVLRRLAAAVSRPAAGADPAG